MPINFTTDKAIKIHNLKMEDKDLNIKGKIATSNVTEKDLQKIRKDLRFIANMSRLAKEKKYRLIISGGYALDGSLGQVTRPHGDIDILLFGQDGDDKQVVEQLLDEVKENSADFPDLELRDKGRGEFYHSYFAQGNGISSDIYYVQVAEDPFGEDKHVVKKDGSISERQEYDTYQVTLEGVSFEATSPTAELVDKLYKRRIRGDEPKQKHDQDIENLRLITDAREVDARLATTK